MCTFQPGHFTGWDSGGVKLFVSLVSNITWKVFIFYFFILSKRAILKSDLLQDQTLLVFATVYMCALFSSDILQAGAVKRVKLFVFLVSISHGSFYFYFYFFIFYQNAQY